MAGVDSDKPFFKYQLVPDSVVISLLLAAKEITGMYCVDYFVNCICPVMLKVLPWMNC